MCMMSLRHLPPLHAILLLEQAKENRLIPVDDPKYIVRTLMPLVISAAPSPEWWEKIFALVEQIAHEVPIYRMQFDKSGKIVEILQQFCN